MKLGVCYYPEHWPEETWQPDAKRMKDLGINWVRIAEFAWSRLEPRSGELNFDWLDRSIDILGAAGLKVVLGTPTATPPKWLIDKYDDILQVGADGHKRHFGSRKHYCFNSLSYREETKRITTLLAERYGKHEAIAAWQTDNEYGCHDTIRCYCDNCKRDFRTWLKEKYGTTDALNEAWWNVFWSMEYQSFDEIDLPFLTTTEAHPSHNLDYYRFASDSMITYNQLQCSIIREHSSYPITHNVMLFFEHFDHFKFAKDIDIVTWDSYPLGMLDQSNLDDNVKAHYLRVGHPDLISFMHDLYVGLKDQPFWVMEQQPGQVNWAPNNPLPAKGAVRLWTHQAFAHGADVVAYFRWRAARGAQELMHAGLNNHDGTEDRASTEAKQVFKELESLDLNTTKLHADVALLFDYESMWASNLQRHAQGWDYWGLMMTYYSALRALGLNVAIIHPRSNLSAYKVAVAPALHLVDDALAKHLEAFVEAGNHLVIGPRSGFKNLTNIAHAPAPGPLAKLMGVNIYHVDAIRPGIKESISFNDKSYPYHTWADVLSPTTAKTLATYQTAAYEHETAISRNLFKKGSCTTIGMWAEADTLTLVLKPILELAQIPLHTMPEGVRLSKRGNISYAMNFNPTQVTLELPDSKSIKLDSVDVAFIKDDI